MPTRRIYTSSSGDIWDLVREEGIGCLHVKHTPNLASGGMGSYIDLVTFLGRNSRSAECVALLEMIGTLIDRD